MHRPPPPPLRHSRPVLEVLILTLERLCVELDPGELSFIWKCLLEKIIESLTNENSIHLTRLLALLTSILQNDYLGKITEIEPLVKHLHQLVETFVVHLPTMKKMDLHSEVIEKVLQLILCVIGCLSDSKNMPALLLVSVLWESVFNIRSRSLLTFLRDLLMKDTSIYHVFGTNIMCAFTNLIDIYDEEVMYIMMKVLMELINAIDKLLIVESKAGLQQDTWYCLLGAALRSYNKLVSRRAIDHEESAMFKFLDLAKRYKLSPQILSAVADILDSVSCALPRKCQCYAWYPEDSKGGDEMSKTCWASSKSHQLERTRLA
ncbi:small subunit processome component 20 [Salvia divinorum]|uniref:Small subunit processome component 20 n=1 Tax=Salvia divinorum TaxID=28513 RepID=A0ABD1G3Y5_SALDI